MAKKKPQHLARNCPKGYPHPMSDAPLETKSPLKRTIALVGLMGAGKSSVGRRLAVQLGVPFKDADDEIVIAAGRPIADIFAERGEDEFRAGERRVIARILDDPPHILATGGGAFMNPVTRVLLRQRATTIWLRADLETLVKRVSRRDDRPLLRNADPRVVMADLMEKRYPTYGEADLIVESREGPHHITVDAVIAALRKNGDLESNT
jgi:shikimate kinase